MTINNKFEIEQIVFLITDDDQQKRIITGIQVCKSHLLYRLACGTTDSWHFEYELKLSKSYV